MTVGSRTARFDGGKETRRLTVGGGSHHARVRRLNDGRSTRQRRLVRGGEAHLHGGGGERRGAGDGPPAGRMERRPANVVVASAGRGGARRRRSDAGGGGAKMTCLDGELVGNSQNKMVQKIEES